MLRPERPTAALLGSRRASRTGARSSTTLGPKKPVLGFLVAPLVGVLLPVFVINIASYQHDTFWPGVIIYLAVAVTVAYASALVFGVPLFLLF